jgi:hypothetical protein
MSITETVQIVKSKISPFYSLILIVVVAVIFFGLGRLSALEDLKTPIKITYPNSDQTGAIMNSVSTYSADGALPPARAGGEQAGLLQGAVSPVEDAGGQVVGNKNSKKYYFPWCSAVKASKPENLVNFTSIEMARTAGYVPGGNCKGLK